MEPLSPLSLVLVPRLLVGALIHRVPLASEKPFLLLYPRVGIPKLRRETLKRFCSLQSGPLFVTGSGRLAFSVHINLPR